MALEPEHRREMERLTPPDGVAAEDWIECLAFYAFLITEDELTPGVHDRVFGVDADNRMFTMGWQVRGLRSQRRGDPGRVGEPMIDLDPVLVEEMAEVDRIAVLEDRFPDVRAEHLQTQTALLRAIRRGAEQATDPSALNTLADAYMSLPAPGEDEHPESA